MTREQMNTLVGRLSTEETQELLKECLDALSEAEAAEAIEGTYGQESIHELIAQLSD